MTSRTAEEWRALRDAGFANPSMCIDAVIENLAACEKERDEWKYTSHNLEAVAEKNEAYEESLERAAAEAEAELAAERITHEMAIAAWKKAELGWDEEEKALMAEWQVERDRAEKAEAERDEARQRALRFHAERDTAKAENADLTLRLEQMRGTLEMAKGMLIDSGLPADYPEWDAIDAALSTPPGELAREVREVLHFAHNDLLDIKERVTDPMLRLYARRSIERIEPLLAKMGGEG